MKTTETALFLVLLTLVGAQEMEQCGDMICSEAQICHDHKCVCTPIRCPMMCPNGFKKDANGCEFPCLCADDDLCGERKCKPNQFCLYDECVCSPVMCRISCPNGFKKDEFGCDICICAVPDDDDDDDDNVDQAHLCHGKVCSDAQICHNDRCECTPLRCHSLCRYGFKKDENGCEYPCICAEPDYSSTPLCGGEMCSAGQICRDQKCVCNPNQCEILCPNGFKIDENGCEYPCTCA